jgi:hypothetical protein
MAQYIGGGLGKAQALMLRLTKLNADCSVPTTPVQCIINECVNNISTDIQIEEGTRIAPKSTSGKECWVIQAKNNVQYVTFPTFQILTIQLKAAAIMTGETTYDLPGTATTHGGETFGISRTIGQQPGSKFALELWSRVATDASNGNCDLTVGGNVLTWYEVWPNVQNGVLAVAQRDETTPHYLGMTGGRGYANSTWGAGPTSAPMPGGAVLGSNVGEFMGYYVSGTSGAPLALPAPVVC